MDRLEDSLQDATLWLDCDSRPTTSGVSRETGIQHSGHQPLRILYLGNRSGTSLHRANALSRLGHDVEIIDPDDNLPPSRLARKFHRESGSLFLGKAFDDRVLASMGDAKRDVLWVDHGRCVSPRVVRAASDKGMRTIVLNVDDPFGYRDRLSWLLFRKSVKEYDLVVVVREPNLDEARKYGAKDVMKVWRSADEVAHRARAISPEEVAKLKTEVLFLGTWMVGRGKFIKDLVDKGVPVSIVGDRWQKAPEWSSIRSNWKCPGVYTDEEYAGYIQCADICIGLLSFQNRDLHTTRSAEIPAIGSLLCAERTVEHLEMYKDGEEAVFWDDADECAQRCKELLADPERRSAIAKAGHVRCIANGTMNEPIMASILERLVGVTTAANQV